MRPSVAWPFPARRWAHRLTLGSQARSRPTARSRPNAPGPSCRSDADRADRPDPGEVPRTRWIVRALEAALADVTRVAHDRRRRHVKALSTFMGHANIRITLDQYGHLLPGAEDEAPGLLDAFSPARSAPPRSSRLQRRLQRTAREPAPRAGSISCTTSEPLAARRLRSDAGQETRFGARARVRKGAARQERAPKRPAVRPPARTEESPRSRPNPTSGLRAREAHRTTWPVPVRSA